MNIALLSPNKDRYSETFIQAHKKRLGGKIFYYFNGEVPTELEGGIVINSRKRRIFYIVKGHFYLNEFSLAEQALMTSFKKNKIDLVFAEYGPTAEKILPICKTLKLPLIAHFHGFDASKVEVLKANQYYAKVFQYASSLVVVSKKMYRDFLEYGCPSEKLVLTACGPHETFAEVKPRFINQQFIAIGRFVDKKAPYYLILSFKKVLESFPDAKLIIAGDGQLWDSCKNLLKFYKMGKSVNLVGVITREKFVEYLKDSIAFVQHSVTARDGDAEGTPVSILEASAAGLPVISTRHAGISDVVIHEKTGFLVEEHDVLGMAEHMIAVLKDPEHARWLGGNGRVYIKENFALEKHIQILNGLLEKAFFSRKIEDSAPSVT